MNPSLQKTRGTAYCMKTIIDLLVRLQQLRLWSQRAAHNPHLTEREKHSLRSIKQLVRDCLPPSVQQHYDGLKRSEPELLKCPEVFAMAVLVSAYRSMSSSERSF